MRLSVLLLPVVLAGSLAGCTDGDPAAAVAFPTPAPSAFAEGTCALVADDVLALGRAARDLGDGPLVNADVVTSFTAAQKALQAVAETAEPELKARLDDVVTRAGLVRLAAEAERYDPQALQPLEESYDRLLESCTQEPAPSR